MARNLKNIKASALTSVITSVASGIKITGLTYTGSATAANPAGSETISVNGSGFNSGASVYIDTTSCATTYVSATSLTFTSPAKSVGSYHVFVYNTDGSSGILPAGFVSSSLPTWVTESGTLTGASLNVSYSTTVSATGDGTITYSITSGSLPTGLSLNSSTGAITGTPTVESTSNFTITATDSQNQIVARSFSIRVVGVFSFNISPAINGMTSWAPSMDGDLIISSPGEYTLIPNSNGSKVVKMWGGAGAPATAGIDGWGSGGAGGAATGTISFAGGTTYKFRVGNSGSTGSANATAYGGGAGNPNLVSQGYAGSGGGYTGIFNTTVTVGNTIMMAGGGGGGAGSRGDSRGGRSGTAGGGTTGQYVADLVSNPGTQSAAGEGGSALQGGNATGTASGGGGGGYGGGGGSSNTHSDGGYGGAGGSGYYNPSVVSTATLYIGSGVTPGNNTDSDRPTNAGAGNSPGLTVYPGAIVIKA